MQLLPATGRQEGREKGRNFTPSLVLPCHNNPIAKPSQEPVSKGMVGVSQPGHRAGKKLDLGLGGWTGK